MRVLIVLITGLVLVPAVVSAQTPPATPLTDLSCMELHRYHERAAEAHPTVDDEVEEALQATAPIPLRELDAVSPAYLQTMATFLEGHAEQLAMIDDPPAAVAELHDLYIARVSLLAQLLRSYADRSEIEALLAIELIVQNHRDFVEVGQRAATTCGEQWESFVTLDPPAWPFLWADWAEEIAG